LLSLLACIAPPEIIQARRQIALVTFRILPLAHELLAQVVNAHRLRRLQPCALGPRSRAALPRSSTILRPVLAPAPQLPDELLLPAQPHQLALGGPALCQETEGDMVTALKSWGSREGTILLSSVGRLQVGHCFFWASHVV
jgi:hypothetical protein